MHGMTARAVTSGETETEEGPAAVVDDLPLTPDLLQFITQVIVPALVTRLKPVAGEEDLPMAA